MPCVNWIEEIQFASVQKVSPVIHSKIAVRILILNALVFFFTLCEPNSLENFSIQQSQKVMIAIQMFAVKTVDVALSTIHQFASVCQNSKVVHRPCHVNHQKMLAQYHNADQTRNAHAYRMESRNARVCQVISKARTRFAVALSQRAPANHSHAVSELLVMLHEAQFAIAPKEPLEIHTDNANHQLLSKNCANQEFVDVSNRFDH